MHEGDPAPDGDEEARSAEMGRRAVEIDRRERAVDKILDDARSRDETAERRDDEAARRDRDADLEVFLDPERSDYEDVARLHHAAALDRQSAKDDRSHSALDRDELAVHVDRGEPEPGSG